jgi:ubiquinone/menaquinone biosynthesis C-methylase UbiE
MRAVRVLSLLFCACLTLSACRTSTAAGPEAPSEPARAEVESKVAAPAAPTAEPKRVARVQEPARSAEAAKPPEIVVPPNRDRHGNADVAAYIAQLENASRIAELRIDTVLEKLALPADALPTDAWVGDLGCGPGAFALAFAKACPEGVVFASDIEPRQLDVVRAKIHSTNLRNIVPVLASEDDPHFPPASLDIVFIGDTYHHLDDRVAYMRRLMKVLKPGGRLVVLDYKPGKLDIGPPPEHKLKPLQMTRELLDAGWKQVEKFDTHPFHDFEIWRPVQPWEKK